MQLISIKIWQLEDPYTLDDSILNIRTNPYLLPQFGTHTYIYSRILNFRTYFVKLVQLYLDGLVI